VAAGGGSGDFLEQEGEVGGERGPSIWREVHGAVLTVDGGNNGGSGFISSEKRRASVARGGQVVTGAQEGGRGVLARLAFTQRGEWRSAALEQLDAEAKRRKGGGGGSAQRTSKWRMKGSGRPSAASGTTEEGAWHRQWHAPDGGEHRSRSRGRVGHYWTSGWLGRPEVRSDIL
jgi:hypothetical protein